MKDSTHIVLSQHQVEECSELQKAVLKYLRNKSSEVPIAIVEEIADVEIMIEQIKQEMYLDNQVEVFKDNKLDRLQHTLDVEIREA